MNVTFNNVALNRPSYNAYQNNNSTNCCKPKPSFTGISGVTKDSALLSPLEKQYNNFANGIAKHFTSKLLDSKPINYLAEKFKDSKNLFQHFLTLGSVVTSGLYMYKTATNDKLDKDRRNTLTVNQGLTLVLSTIGAYSLDKAINPWWENQTAKYISNQLKDDGEFFKNFVSENNKIIKENKLLKSQGKKAEMKSTRRALDMLYESKLYQNSLENVQSVLNNRVKGFGALKSMLVFGFVYRYFVPVVVTKPSNVLCEKYLERKQHKKEQMANKA